jgi:hypothetical protein
VDRQYDQPRCELLREGSPTALLLLAKESATGRTNCPATLNAVSTRKFISAGPLLIAGDIATLRFIFAHSGVNE